MNKKLIVGDIHGHWDVLEKSINYADKNGYDFIQVGDLSDSFNRSIKDQKRSLEIAKDASRDDNKTFLLGNHDLAYLFPEYFWCSGVTKNKVGRFQETYQQILFDYYTHFDNVLVTHAGFSKTHLDFLHASGDVDKLTLSVPEILDEALETANYIYKAGRDSGGKLKVGGIFWLRPWNFEPIEGWKQVFGHTAITNFGVKQHNESYNVDNIEYGKQELLAYEDGKFRIISKGEYQ